jgi:hypothetical protein
LHRRVELEDTLTSAIGTDDPSWVSSISNAIKSSRLWTNCSASSGI